MEQRKMTPEEIQVLRQKAEEERMAHAQAMANIEYVSNCQGAEKERMAHALAMADIKFVSNYQSTMLYERQLEIVKSAYNRGREEEVLALLKAYIDNPLEDSLSPAVKLFIYDDANELAEAKEFMLQNKLLCFEVEKQIFNDKLAPFYQDGTYPPFSLAGEKYMVEQTLKDCKKVETITTELDFLTKYVETHQLGAAAEEALTNFLLVSCHDDKLEKFVVDYASRYAMASSAQIRMIQIGAHDAIMAQIQKAPKNISDPKVVDAVLTRGNPDEVKAYFYRYGREV